MIRSPAELLVHELSAIRDAETQASQALQGHLRLVENDELRRHLERRLEQGQRLLQEVTRGLERLGGQAEGRQNAAALGLIEEARALLERVEAPEMRQAVLIAGVQKLEHYCIAAWGTVRAIAGELGQQELAAAMQRAVEEGYRLDRELSELAEGWVNPTAIEQADLAEAEDGGQEAQSATDQGQGTPRLGDDDPELKRREYRGEDGKLHHHTREYMERKDR